MVHIVERIKDLWWLYVVYAIIAILFGLAALFAPGLVLATLIVLLAAYLLVIGIVDVVGSFVSMKKDNLWLLSLLTGLLSAGLGVYLLKTPDVAAITFVSLIGALFIVRGIVDVVMATMLREKGDVALFVVGGILSVLTGIVVWIYPGSATLAFVWVLGLYAIIRGAVDLAIAINAKSMTDDVVRSVRASKR